PKELSADANTEHVRPAPVPARGVADEPNGFRERATRVATLSHHGPRETARCSQRETVPASASCRHVDQEIGCELVARPAVSDGHPAASLARRNDPKASR